MARVTVVLALSLACAAALAGRAPAVDVRTDILQLGARLNSLERELGRHNDRFLQNVSQVRALETELETHQRMLAAANADARQRDIEQAQILRSYHLAVIEDEAVPDESYAALLKLNRTKAATALAETQTLATQITAFQARLETLKRDEQELQQLTGDMAVRKEELTRAYMGKLAARQKAEVRQDVKRISAEVKRVMTAPVLPTMRFQSPMDGATQVSASEKGVTYKFGGTLPLKAPRDGRVIYNGELASYGNVLMLDHGDDIRTVMLGRFRSDLAKNTKVNAGDVLGHTAQDGDSLYFEVRKKNVAQNTIHWLAPSTAGKI
jgi:murein DD-endopeptidase MepM/ murein hydrolase activator NlpD